jgi:hypothetical protein
MRSILTNVAGLIAAALATSIIGSVFSTQSVIASLQSINVAIPFATRLSMTVNDLGILPALGSITLICFIFGFIVAALCKRFIGGSRTIWHITAGAVAIISTLLIMKAILLVSPIAGARSTLGLLSFGLAGAIGGWIFDKTTSTDTAQSGETS